MKCIIDTSADREQIERYNKLAKDYINLSPAECKEFDELSEEVLSFCEVKPLQNVSLVWWLPFPGIVNPPINPPFKPLLVTNGKKTAIATYDGYSWNCEFVPTLYAELP